MSDYVRGIDRGYYDAGVARPARYTYGLPEAPIDGKIYGRKDAQWVVVIDLTGEDAGAPGPATALPLSDSGTGVVGTSVKYAREDHRHPELTGLDPTLIPPYLIQNAGVK
jgi:hypothetical protein